MRAVLWDLDGTLIDSADYHFRSWVTTLNEIGFHLTREEFGVSFGQRNDRILRKWLGSDVSDEDIRRIGDEKEADYRRLMLEGGLESLPGAQEWIDRLAAQGWRQAIASSAPRMNVDTVIEVLGWTGRFDATVAAEDVTRGKPDPEVFLTAAARVGVAPAMCIVMEDAHAGVEAAKRAGMHVIGIGPGAAAADLTTPSLRDLPEGSFDRLLNETGLWQRSRS